MIYKDMPASWRRTFLTLWLGCFITGLGFSMTMPFMALYIESFGHYSRTQINFYSGLAFSVTYFAQAVVSPYWGNLADRKGRKLMCLRASGVMTFTVFLTGLATNVYMIIFLRLLQGAFSGYINNSTAFMAGEAPKGHSGAIMSQMMTASVTGNLLGPMFGGAIAGIFGYRAPFMIFGVLMGIVFLMTLTTKEHFTPIPAKEADEGSFCRFEKSPPDFLHVCNYAVGSNVIDVNFSNHKLIGQTINAWRRQCFVCQRHRCCNARVWYFACCIEVRKQDG